MMRRVGELNKENARLKAEVERLKKFNDEALAHVAKEERKSRERLDMEQAENARLKAEVEELKSQPDPLTAYLYADTLRRDDIKTLKAHIERLTKAGDAMAELMFIDKDYIGSAKQESVVGWCKATEAKEGKPRA
jgi:predicted nuclease with TOPRIM domain